MHLNMTKQLSVQSNTHFGGKKKYLLNQLPRYCHFLKMAVFIFKVGIIDTAL